jgi:hypothetical protein
MKCPIIFLTLIITISCAYGQNALINSTISPKGDIEFQYTDNDSCICMDVWLVNRIDTSQKFRLDSAITLGTKYYFSPDEKWIAANHEFLSDLREISLYKRIRGIKYSHIDNFNIFEKAIVFLSTKKHLRYIPGFGHKYVQIIRWLPSSESFLIRIDGWDNRQGLVVRDWTCIFNINSNSVSEDKNNHGKVSYIEK